MVYRKRTRKPRRIIVKRRRFMMKKRSRYTKKKYDGIVFRKLYADANMVHDAVAGNATVSINFGSAVAPPNGYIRHTSIPEWIQYAAIFKEYKIMGIKL